jgi:hypothetical protein
MYVLVIELLKYSQIQNLAHILNSQTGNAISTLGYLE